ncbi:MAG: hypothetical protein ACOZCO_00240 [Bacteroidota bacterium]
MILTETQRQLFLAISLRMSTAVIAEKVKNEKRVPKKQRLYKPSEKIAA